MKVFDIMSEHIVTVGLGEPVAAAARLLKQYNIGAVPVCDERGNLRGMTTPMSATRRGSWPMRRYGGCPCAATGALWACCRWPILRETPTATRKLRKLYVKFLKTSAECSIYHSHCAQILL